MNQLFSVVLAVCASSLICTLFSTFVTDGSTKKLLSLVLGAFIICCMTVPVKNAFESAQLNMSEYTAPEEITSTDDEAYSKAVLAHTKSNLEQALCDLLLQNGIAVNRCEIILSQTDKNSIIISSVNIYINNDYLNYTNTISDITYDNFGVRPSITTE